jgi:hypothetical protein
MGKKAPDWTSSLNASKVWSEDDADVGLPGHVTLVAAFSRRYKLPILDPVEVWDEGDAVYKLLPAGIVLVESYPGNSEIRELPVRSANKAGVCCACGFTGEEETVCYRRADQQHCVHWWDGTDERRWSTYLKKKERA